MLRKIVLLAAILFPILFFVEACTQQGEVLEIEAKEEVSFMELAFADESLKVFPDESGELLEIEYEDEGFSTSGVIGGDFYVQYESILEKLESFDLGDDTGEVAEEIFSIKIVDKEFETDWDTVQNSLPDLASFYLNLKGLLTADEQV